MSAVSNTTPNNSIAPVRKPGAVAPAAARVGAAAVGRARLGRSFVGNAWFTVGARGAALGNGAGVGFRSSKLGRCAPRRGLADGVAPALGCCGSCGLLLLSLKADLLARDRYRVVRRFMYCAVRCLHRQGHALLRQAKNAANRATSSATSSCVRAVPTAGRSVAACRPWLNQIHRSCT
jgi:hypothetical protein